MKITLAIQRGIVKGVDTYTQRKLKLLFKIFFEGYDEADIPEHPQSISSMMITDISFEKVNDVIVMTITLGRPGLLIGKGGETIDALTKYLSSSQPVKLHLIESRLWS